MAASPGKETFSHSSRCKRRELPFPSFQSKKTGTSLPTPIVAHPYRGEGAPEGQTIASESQSGNQGFFVFCLFFPRRISLFS
ncbi:hypothetical protein F9C07_8269 [Aspergillus flavus]|uniref:Uncharacterized protein n=1 Tax=Aspergillus flavus (strain ATCC 200026 / FGSC A1120 / IAM 13836 / NRRL 3357 / JCM 12722 / SRRC 167) TaxID=332952 RepID=A0A7U2R396_ASPFN|nr:hypothetical protein AFLA70_135g002111 [Aspergillus flavus AF70]QRD93822.1 hypothetical protein F9C07_8269 [Aspergillus flavus]